MKVFLFTMILFFQITLYAQTFDTRGTTSPPVVNTDFMKTIHTGINYQNGKSNLSIPLFSLPIEEGIEIPIELNYDAGGIKYGQSSGEVGVGWSISSNYRFTRTIYGRPDEFFTRPTEGEVNSIMGLGNNARDQFLTRFTFGLASNGGQDLRSNETVLDSEHDIFDYSTPFLTGSFVIKDFNTKALFSSDNKLAKFDFTLNNEGIRSFLVVDSKGNRIIAGKNPEDGSYMTEFVSTYMGKKGSYAWPVTEIQTLNGRKAYFKYTLETLNDGAFSGDRTIQIIEGAINPYQATTIDDINDGTTASQITYLTESIKTDYGSVNIFRSGGTKMIDSIFLYDIGGNLVKKAIFNYSYHLQYRFLDSVVILGNNGDQMQKFEFEYYDRDVEYLTTDIWGNLRLPGGDESNAVIIRYPKEFSNETYIKYTWGNGVVFEDQLPLTTVISNMADRSPRGTPSFLSLKKIAFPGGGYIKYDYEPNYYYSGGKKQGPGIRTSRITTYNYDNSKLLEKNYSYGEGNDGIGEIPLEVTSDFYCLEQVLLEQNTGSTVSFSSRRMRTFSNVPIADSDPFFTRYNIVSYPVVKETDGNGYTLYYYENGLQGIWTPTRRFGPAITYQYNMWAKPRLSKTEWYDNGGDLKESEEWKYGRFYEEMLYGVKVKPFAIFLNRFTPPTTGYSYGNINSIYDYGAYAMTFGAYSPLEKIVTKKLGNLTLTTKTEFEYNQNNQLVKEKLYGSDSIYREVQYLYANNLQSPTTTDSVSQDILNMQRNNFINNWIERRFLQRDQVTGSLNTSKSEFVSYFQGKSKIRNKFEFNSAKPTIQFIPVNISGGKVIFDSKYLKSIEQVDQIDQYGNIVSMTDQSGVYKAFIWDNGKYPIAEVVNATYSDIAFAGFESGGLGNWTTNGSVVDAGSNTFDGTKFLSLTPGAWVSKNGLMPSKKYRVSVWSYSADGPLGDGFVATMTKGGFTCFEKVFTGQTTFTYSSTKYLMLDNLSLCPEDALMTTYTYKPLVGVVRKTDPRGHTEYYEYDSFGRLSLIKDFNGHILRDFRYHYRP